MELGAKRPGYPPGYGVESERGRTTFAGFRPTTFTFFDLSRGSINAASLTSPFIVKMALKNGPAFTWLTARELAIGLWSNNGYVNSTSRLMYGREVVNEGVG